MSGEQLASLTYLGLLGVVIAGWYIASHRRALNKLAQNAAIWGFIFLGAIVAAGLWMDIRDDLAPRQASFRDGAVIEVPRAIDGHYYLTLEINGTPVRFVVDTGASDLVLSRADAARVGIDVERLFFAGRAMTANGMVETAPVRLERVALAGVAEQGVRGVVNGGEMDESLLGMSYLSRFDRLEIADGRLILER